MQPHVTDDLPVDDDATARGFNQAEQRHRHGRLAGACPPYDSHLQQVSAGVSTNWCLSFSY